MSKKANPRNRRPLSLAGILASAIICFLCCSVAHTEVAEKSPDSQTLRIHWLPLTMDQEYIENCVKLAHAFDVDAFHLSHTIVHDAEDVIEDTRRRSEVLKAIKTMKDAGLEIWCWTHEIKKLPPGIRKGQFSLRDPLLEKFLQDKYDNFVTEVLPGLDGIVLTLAETGVKVYQNVTAEEARQNVSDLVGILHEPLSGHDVRLAVRSFVYKKEELDIVEAATSDMPADVAVMSKIYPHDWQPYYPVNPIIGAVGEREQWVEFDLGFEFEGQNTVPYSDPHGRIRQLNHLWDKGLRTVSLRLDRYHGNEGKSAISTPWGMLNLTVFSEFKKNRDVKAAEIISKWEQGQFPGAWTVLELSTAITRRAMFPKKQWYQNHSVIPDFGYAKSHLKGGSADRLATWTGLEQDRRAEDLCDKPTPEWYREILAEDMQNQRDLERIEEILSENKVDLSKYPVWEKGIKALRMNAELYAASKKAYFAVRLHQNMPEAMPKEQAAACIDEFDRVVRRLDPLPEYARCRKYAPGSTLPKAVGSLRKELPETPAAGNNGTALSQVPKKIREIIEAELGKAEIVSQVQIYESPPTARKSGKFKVAVNGQTVFVEQLPVEKSDLYIKFSGCEALSYHCARFAFDGQAKVRVTADGGADGYRLRPTSAGIQTKLNGSTVEFIMTEPRNLMLDLGLTWLYIFADPLKNDAPQLDRLKEADFKGDTNKKVLLDKQDRKVVNVMNYSPDPSGEKLSTREIQKAIIDTAAGPYPGGTLYFPSGVYKTGSLRLYSNVTLYLADGALIQGSKNPADYPLPFGVEHGPPNRDYGYDYALIKVHHCENVAIRGRGTIDAGGAANGRLKIIHAENSRNVTVEDVVVRNTIGWMFPILHSENVTVKNARVISPITSNTDGINPDSSINVTLDGNFIVSGDDSVAVKATNFGMWLRDEIKNIRVVNNVLLTMKSSLKIGTETQARHIHDVVFENNDILMADRAFTIYLRDGALIENVTFRNNRLEIAGGLHNNKNRPIDIDISRRDDDIWRNPRFYEALENPGNIRNVLFENITIETKESHFLAPSKISGHNRDNAVSNIVFRNLRVNGQNVLDPSVSIPVGDTGKAKTFMTIDADATRNIIFE